MIHWQRAKDLQRMSPRGSGKCICINKVAKISSKEPLEPCGFTQAFPFPCLPSSSPAIKLDNGVNPFNYIC